MSLDQFIALDQTSIIPNPLPSSGNGQWKVTTGPTVEPITSTELKTFARIDGSTEDTLLDSFIVAVRQACEKYLGRSLLEQTIKLSLDFWPSTVVELPMPPLLSVTQVRTLDEDDAVTAYASSNYYVRTLTDPGQIVLRQGSTPPINTARWSGGIEIEYKAGYGTAATSVPAAIKEAIKLWATLVYENRLPIQEPPKEAKLLLNYYKIYKV